MKIALAFFILLGVAAPSALDCKAAGLCCCKTPLGGLCCAEGNGYCGSIVKGCLCSI